MTPDLELWLVALGAMLVGGVIKGVFGMGLPVTAMAALTLFVPPQIAVGILALPVLVSNFQQISSGGPIRETVRAHWPIVATLIPVMLVATGYVRQTNTDILLTVLGLAIVSFAVLNLSGRVPPLPDAWRLPAALLAGALAGVLGGLTAIWAPPCVMYFLGLRLEKDDLVRALGFVFFCGAVPLVVGYTWSGVLNAQLAPLSAAACLPAWAGFKLGEIVRRYIAPARFRTALLLMFLLIGLNLIRRAVM